MGWRCICLLLGAVTAAPTRARGRRAAAETATAETAAADIVRRVLAGTPTFDDERGAVVVPAGRDCTSALNEAMLAANSAGGGTVATRDGAAYELDGPLNLLSHVRLRVGRGTTLRFGYSAPQRPPVLRSAEGVVFHGPSPLVRAYRAHGARVEGRGPSSVIDGGGRAWHEKNAMVGSAHRTSRIKEMGHEPSEHGRVDQRTPPTLLELFGSTRIVVSSLTLRDSAFWTAHCVLSYGVLLENIHVDSRGRNTDGIVIDSSTDVVARRNSIVSGDDGISIKSGRDEAGRSVGRPTEDLVLMDNVIVKASAGGVAVGSEVSGGIRRVYVLNTTITKATIACYVKSTPGRGAYVQDIYVRDVVAEQVKECITVTASAEASRRRTPTHWLICAQVNANFKNPTPKPQPARPTDFRRLSFENVLCRSLSADSRAINLAGRPSYPLRGVRLADVSVLGEVRKALAIAYATDVSIAARVGATAFDLRNVSAEDRRTWNATT